ncbi:MAG: hypothetical protein SPJ17_02585 [Anaeroplasma sp.]|uniref:hypothetical protein n=1 Tax=Anaeroplasma sp. TaxID=1872523 RepID=UPI002A918528|nr:hypothetical protein [Anaeroplasma sp.]MDY5982576.1 hypothetical protein [Anaeroplasma sp.]
MSTYDETLDALKIKLQDYFKKAETQDSQEPLSFSLYNLRQAVDTYIKQMKNICSKLKPLKQEYDNLLKELSSAYNEKKKTLEEKLKADTSNIISKYEEKCNALKDEMKEKEREIHFEENNILMDIEFFIMASDQNKEMFEAEYNENVSRFNYQIQIASDSYSENTIRFNDKLEKELKKIENKYKASLIDYDKDTERIIAHYQKNVDELNEVLAKKIDEFNKYQILNKQKKVKESMEFNDKIRLLVSKRNEKNQDARNEYARKQAEAQEDKEQKRQEYHAESQKISKEFVLNMTTLDDRIAYLKKEYNDRIYEEQRALQYRLLELKKEEESLLIESYSSPGFKKKAKKIKAEYFGYQELERKNTNKTLVHLKKAYLMNTEKTNYQKKLLDLDRTFNMKFIVENETYDNKKFQEINNEYEIDMNHAVQINNLDYNREANKLRSENNLKTLKEERNADEADTLHQIDTEKLICQIKSIKYEIASFEEIKKLLHKFETDKFNTTLTFKTVNNTLEIEKCKVLDTLNKSMYDLNIKSSKMVLETSNQAIDLKNKEYEYKNQSKIKRNKLVLNTEQKLVDYQIENFNRDRDLELAILNRNYFFELDTLGHDYLASRFELEFKKIMMDLSLLSDLIELVHYMQTCLMNIIYDKTSNRPEYKMAVWGFINDVLAFIFQGYQRIISIFHDDTNKLIRERIEFEESLKYKGFYKNIEANYKEEYEDFLDRKEVYEKQAKDVSEELESNKSLLFALDNEIYIKRKALKNKPSNPQKERQEIFEATNKYKEIENENIILSKKLFALQKEINRIDNQIGTANLSYTRQQDEIKKMQLTNAQGYFELEKALERHISSSIVDMNTRLKEQEISDEEFKDSIKIVQEKNEVFQRLSQSFIEGIYQIMNRFLNNEKEAIIKSANILEAGYKIDLAEMDRDDKNERVNAKATYLQEEQARQEEIIQFDRETQNTLNQLKFEISNHDQVVKKLAACIQEKMDLANQCFYQDYYAICENQKDIIHKQNEDIKSLESEYQKNRAIIFDRFKKSKVQLKIMLKEYISSRNEILKHLPVAEKENLKAFRLDDYKQNIELDERYVEVKAKSTSSMKEVLKNKDLIKAAFDSKQTEIERDHRLSRQKEKRIHQAQMRRI